MAAPLGTAYVGAFGRVRPGRHYGASNSYGDGPSLIGFLGDEVNFDEVLKDADELSQGYWNEKQPAQVPANSPDALAYDKLKNSND
ncbi:hypothetical protein CPLU01_10531 [Colletotrichum plurivorum]|uniref:Uncharacterized protein n=1 Tax=Colletotrichum plurivorum TaxID=2175906 RepID=A0A8H6K4K3_9PEZI|nr:hypothetical protein CPLU01_10531 [Colletotrichum plurivorum]